MNYRLEYRTIWEFGQRKDSDGRPHQEDSIYPVHNSSDMSSRLFIVCDGMGGHDNGEIASSIVCKTLSDHIGVQNDQMFNVSQLNDAIEKAYDCLDKHDNGASKKMGTTLALLKLHHGGATIAHIGDSRVYHIRPGKDGDPTQILFETKDHSLVNDLVKIGEMTPSEAKTSKQRHIITRAIQSGNHCKADVYETTDILPGDYFYLCSDGMLEQMEDEAICNIFSHSGGNIEQKVDILTGATSSNRDNHSALLVHIIFVDNLSAVSDRTTKQKLSSSFNIRWKNFMKF